MDPRRRTGSRLVQPSPESFKSRPGWHRPKPNMAGTRNPFGRRPHPGSRLHLTSTKPTCQNQQYLGRVTIKTTSDLDHRLLVQIFHLMFQFSAFYLYPNPPAPRESLVASNDSNLTLALSGASRRNQIPSSHPMKILLRNSAPQFEKHPYLHFSNALPHCRHFRQSFWNEYLHHL